MHTFTTTIQKSSNILNLHCAGNEWSCGTAGFVFSHTARAGRCGVSGVLFYRYGPWNKLINGRVVCAVCHAMMLRHVKYAQTRLLPGSPVSGIPTLGSLAKGSLGMPLKCSLATGIPARDPWPMLFWIYQADRTDVTRRHLCDVCGNWRRL